MGWLGGILCLMKEKRYWKELNLIKIGSLNSKNYTATLVVNIELDISQTHD